MFGKITKALLFVFLGTLAYSQSSDKILQPSDSLVYQEYYSKISHLTFSFNTKKVVPKDTIEIEGIRYILNFIEVTGKQFDLKDIDNPDVVSMCILYEDEYIVIGLGYPRTGTFGRTRYFYTRLGKN